MRLVCSFGCAAPALALALAATASAAAPAVPGHAILARAEGDALVIWDSTLEVTDIVKNKLSDAAAKDRLERDALNELALEAPRLGKVTSVDVRVVYTKTGDVSPAYGSPTFAGIERYATLTMSASDLADDRGKWREAAAGTGAIPGWVAFAVSGDLPPR